MFYVAADLATTCELMTRQTFQGSRRFLGSSHQAEIERECTWDRQLPSSEPLKESASSQMRLRGQRQ